MHHKTPIRCSRLLENASLPVLERVQKLQRLEQAVLQVLPAELAAHCKVMNLRKETLVLCTTSSAWAARLRFAAPELCKQLQCQFSLKPRAVQVRIQPETYESPLIHIEKPRLSLTSGDLLAQTARTVDHPGLRDALYRLAAKARDF
jgi:hypothetical protein